MKLQHQFALVACLVLIAIVMKCSKERPSLKKFDLEEHLTSYDDYKAAIAQKQKDWQEYYTVASPMEQKKLIEKSRNYLNKQISEHIFDAWYGTKWNFHGTTQTPRKGSIACGYFVTTTLEHAGFKVPRVKMAQQAASVMIKSLCDPRSIKNHSSLESLEAYLDTKPDGLFILGLDKHVGYILRLDGENYFVHSSLSQGRKVVKEKLDEARTVKRSKVKMLGDLTGHDWLIKQWLESSPIALKK
jgi:hypothetical protein